MDKEYQRRSKPVPANFDPYPAEGQRVTLAVAEKVLMDIKNFESNPANDWTGTFMPWDLASAGKWKPVLVYVKGKMSEIVPKP